MKAPAARTASPPTLFLGARERAAFQADQAAPPTRSSDPPRFVMRGRTAGTSIAPRAGTCALSSSGLVFAIRIETKATIDTTTIAIVAIRPARGGISSKREPRQ